MYLTCNKRSWFLITQLIFLLEPSDMSIWSCGFYLQWLRLLKISFDPIKTAEDKHGYKYSSENDQMTPVSLQCLTWRRLLIRPMCLSVKAINISDDDKTPKQAL